MNRTIVCFYKRVSFTLLVMERFYIRKKKEVCYFEVLVNTFGFFLCFFSEIYNEILNISKCEGKGIHMRSENPRKRLRWRDMKQQSWNKTC